MSERRYVPMSVPGRFALDPPTFHVYDRHERRPVQRCDNLQHAADVAEALNTINRKPQT